MDCIPRNEHSFRRKSARVLQWETPDESSSFAPFFFSLPPSSPYPSQTLGLPRLIILSEWLNWWNTMAAAKWITTALGLCGAARNWNDRRGVWVVGRETRRGLSAYQPRVSPADKRLNRAQTQIRVTWKEMESWQNIWPRNRIPLADISFGRLTTKPKLR